MFWLKIIKKILKSLNAEADPKEIALAAVLGMFIGMSPGFVLQDLFFILLIFILKVNISSAFLAVVVFGVFTPLLDPLANKLGIMLLSAGSLTSFWTKMANMALIPFSKFNNSVVMGMLIISILLMVPIYFLSIHFVNFYRSQLQQKIEKLKIVKLLKASKLVKLYQRLS